LLLGWICRVGCACVLDLVEGVRVCYRSMVTWRDYYVLSYPAKSTTLRFVRARVSKAKRLPGKVLPVEAPNLGYASPKGP
jgi:hypothetical protein